MFFRPLRLRLLATYLLPASVILCILGWQSRTVFAQTGCARAVISEVMWMGSDIGTSDEWVEIACAGTDACDLSGWTITSLKGTGEEAVLFTFPETSILASDRAAIIGNFSLAASRLSVDPWFTTSAMSLPNTKLLLKLRDTTGIVRDEADDGVGNPFAGANPSGGAKASMERIDLLAPGNQSSGWRTATESLGFKPGPAIFGTPGFIIFNAASSFASSASSESSASSDSSSQESSNVSSEISSVSSESSASSASSVSSGSSESSASSVSSASSASSESSASSVSSESSESSCSSSQESSSVSGEASSVSSESSASSVSSGSSASSVSSVSSVLITEVLANPAGADTDEWIEIANPGAENVNIAGWKLDDGNSAAVYTIPPRSGGVFLLAPGEYVSFRKSVTGLPLDNTGERVSLMSGATLIDAWSYPETAEEVSYGRDPASPSQSRAFCVPTPDRPNIVLPPAARIVIQSASDADAGASAVTATDHLSLNLTAEAGAGSLASAECIFDFGDDTVLSGCNPPSHSFDEPGTYRVRLTVRDFCGSVDVRTLTVNIVPEEQEEAQKSSSSSRESSASSQTSHTSASSVSSASSFSSSSSVVLVSLAVPMSVERGVILSEVQMTGAEWIEFFNPADQEISLAGWTLDDVRDGGSKPWAFPQDIAVGAGEYFVLPASATTLKLNDDGDEVRLVAPDGSSSEHVSVPPLKTGISFSRTDGAWCLSDETPGEENRCRNPAAPKSKSASSASKKTSGAKKISSVFRTRYVAEISSEAESGTLVSDVPEGLESLVVTGEEGVSGESSSFPLLVEMTITGVLGAGGVILFFALRGS
ncbi:MAG: lamin tail domain-containing protein [Candidatus Peribacteraceae bacterium]|nr:lamin tail domain-containing protein [Candidatus Peribacteraceae bacterium]MDD5074682.1 lamin tail domain-containing protein [Candidatus Peribacteraceae bacterium]